VVHIEEGPQTRVARLAFEGNETIPEQELRTLLISTKASLFLTLPWRVIVRRYSQSI